MSRLFELLQVHFPHISPLDYDRYIAKLGEIPIIKIDAMLEVLRVSDREKYICSYFALHSSILELLNTRSDYGGFREIPHVEWNKLSYFEKNAIRFIRLKNLKSLVKAAC